jgi:hypothetical protein
MHSKRDTLLRVQTTCAEIREKRELQDYGHLHMHESVTMLGQALAERRERTPLPATP